MEINVAKNAGFCFGVKNAIDKVTDLALSGKRLYTYGDIIHNKHVINSLNEMGVISVDDLDELVKISDGSAVIRSHGAPPGVYEAFYNAKIEIIDLTCPFVKRIHDLVREAANQNKSIIIIGELNHPEVLGIRGWAGDNSYVIFDQEDILKLPKFDKAVVVAQTTTNLNHWGKIIAKLKEEIPDLTVYNTICETTKNRQDEAVELAKQSDVMIVVGGKNSSNTKRLYELCAKYCKRTYHIENTGETVLENLKRDDIINIIAGASTPDWLIREVFLRMSEIEKTLATGEEQNNSEEEQAKDVQSDIKEEETLPKEDLTKDTDESQTLEPSENSFMEEIDKSLVRLRKGQFVTGTIVQLTDEEAFVNIGYKSDGILTKSEFSANGSVSPKSVLTVGDEIDVEIVSLNDGQGNVALSRRRIEAKIKWDEFAQDAEQGKGEKEYVCKVKKVIKGGVLGKIEGYDTFIPASHVSIKFTEDLKVFLNKDLPVVIIEVDKAKKRIVASHKEILKKEENKKLDKLYATFVKGETIEGTVKRLTDFGAFVDIGGTDALLHIRDISWVNIKHPSEVLNVGDKITTVILNTDVEKRRISIGYKQLQPKPWDGVDTRYLVGSEIEAKVIRTVPFGAFVELEPGVDGLIHISQIANRRLERVEDEIKAGDTVKVKITEVDAKKKKISLSRRQLIVEALEAKSPKKEDRGGTYERYEIPPIQETTVTLGDFFPKEEIKEEVTEDLAVEEAKEAIEEESIKGESDIDE